MYSRIILILKRYPQYPYPRAQRPQSYQPARRPQVPDYYHYSDYYDDGWVSASGMKNYFHNNSKSYIDNLIFVFFPEIEHI